MNYPAAELRSIKMNFYLINPDAEHRGILLIKLNCGAQRHHYSMFNVGRSMFDVQSARPARNALRPVLVQFNIMNYISISTPTQRAMHGRRALIFQNNPVKHKCNP
jgi:hypothetical protein